MVFYYSEQRVKSVNPTFSIIKKDEYFRLTVFIKNNRG